MDGIRRMKLSASEARCTLWVAACFALTSGVYLAWVHRLVELRGDWGVDWLTMVSGYLCQAIGLALVCRTRRVSQARRVSRGIDRRRWFAVALALFAAFSVPALAGDRFAGTAVFGLLMNVACGIIAGLYLYGVSAVSGDGRGSLPFGAGYAIATFAVGLLALPAKGALLKSPGACILGLAGCGGLALASRRSRFFDAQAQEDPPASALPDLPMKTLALACGAVLLPSMVKNMGFTFPVSDIAAGLPLELSRLPYGIGLLAAGWINDRDRKYGILCAIIALSVPFVMLSVQSEPIPRVVLWGLDYLFYSFFTVTRVMLFIDIAHKTRRWALVPAGLLAGRLGDAAGTAIGLLLAQERLALILVTALGYALGVVLLFRLWQSLYGPRPAEGRSEQEVFEAFCLRHDLTLRERDILRMLLENRTNTDIAEGLFISENTVKYHVRNVLQKTGCKNRVDLQKRYKLALYPHLGASQEG